jgi:esterase/lipase superfamily enzyme
MLLILLFVIQAIAATCFPCQAHSKSGILCTATNMTTSYNSPLEFLKQLNDPELWKMDIILGTSNWDICFDANIKLSDILESRGVGHWLDVRKNRHHDWPLWKEMFPHYLSRIKFD